MENATMAKPLISIIVPVYNEAENITLFYETVTDTLASLQAQYRFEIIFTDNHSTDNSFAMLSALAHRDARVRVIRFSRNFGYQRSILTGYLQAKGDAAIQLDCDLQDPPQMIAQFLAQWQQGSQVVYGVRVRRREGRLIW